MKNNTLIVSLLVVVVAVYLWRRKKNSDTGVQENSTGLLGLGAVIPSLFKVPTIDTSASSVELVSSGDRSTSDSAVPISDRTSSTTSTSTTSTGSSGKRTWLRPPTYVNFTFKTNKKSPFACMRDLQK